MPFFRMLKRGAKLALRNLWGQAIRVTVFVAAVTVIIAALQSFALQFLVIRTMQSNPTMELHGQFIGGLFSFDWPQMLILSVFTVITLLLLCPIMLGATRFYYRVANAGVAGFSELFYFFDSFGRYKKAVWHTIQISVRAFLWGVLIFAFPVGIMAISVSFLSIDALERSNQTAASAGILLSIGLFVLAAVIYLIVINKYALSGYLLCAGDGYTVKEAINASIRHTKGERGIILIFALSFAPWYLLIPFTFGLLTFFVAPYHSAATAMLCRYFAEKNPAAEVTESSSPSKSGE